MILSGAFGGTKSLFYALAAIMPALFLMGYIYRIDSVEREPRGLLMKLVVGGLLSALGAMILETVLEPALDVVLDSVSASSVISGIAVATMVAVSEEGCKFFFLKRFSWNHPEFNFRFDGVVYAVFVSLGFAAIENVLYVYSYGMEVLFTRALLTVPAHMAFAVYMGMFYGRAKICDVRGQKDACRSSLRLSLLSAIAMHAFYDGTLMAGTDLSFYMFIGFVVLMYVVVYNTVRKESYTDESIY
jgi:RsiW-degrading membrane proteinase PrsW (M82 family)